MVGGLILVSAYRILFFFGPINANRTLLELCNQFTFGLLALLCVQYSLRPLTSYCVRYERTSPTYHTGSADYQLSECEISRLDWLREHLFQLGQLFVARLKPETIKPFGQTAELMSLDWDATKSVSALYEWLPQKCYLVQIPPSRLFFFWLPTAVSDIAMM